MRDAVQDPSEPARGRVLYGRDTSNAVPSTPNKSRADKCQCSLGVAIQSTGGGCFLGVVYINEGQVRCIRTSAQCTHTTARQEIRNDTAGTTPIHSYEHVGWSLGKRESTRWTTRRVPGTSQAEASRRTPRVRSSWPELARVWRPQVWGRLSMETRCWTQDTRRRHQQAPPRLNRLAARRRATCVRGGRTVHVRSPGECGLEARTQGFPGDREDLHRDIQTEAWERDDETSRSLMFNLRRGVVRSTWAQKQTQRIGWCYGDEKRKSMTSDDGLGSESYEKG
ncbi:hypothetical protein K488DRAFT_74969 [Vararia minispora EC-137]|uniref:Uncharacterized protein n=1 Tax=Vararia minispora EC-137 TaxID=1314806 RepID=A0ACB8Q640_9AGAM|nr:hypothetical protein K488DRAFT_74969 [Vararia minispora EC-137]